MPPDVAVIIASYRRPQVLAETLESLSRQTLPGFQLIVSIVNVDDCPQNGPLRETLQVCVGSAGSSVQRNRAMALLDPAVRFVAFLDDDVELAPDYLEKVREVFLRNEKLAAFSGSIVEGHADERPRARQALAEPTTVADPLAEVSPLGGLYGCGMNVRREILEQEKFDERLRRYGWLEDADFGVRVRKWGAVGGSRACRLYHLRAPQGRVSGKAFGFAQIMNPFYLAHKGTLPWREAWTNHAAKVVFSNLRGYLANDKKVDRVGRLAGNWLAFRRLAAGRVAPEEIDDL
jgi:GT2 family glycosyltransferase